MTQLGKILGGSKAGMNLTLLLCLFGGTVMAKEVLMFTVEYAPGGTDQIHRHNTAFVYVLEGSIVK